ncbi:hypothetical protein SAMN04489732_1307 [Amycolatopsis saalfeldensis]|uniref:Uncharacterized protein n=1 Tax=Amycolatopsis saalfeldensis TaxID=394193 RepID=A0A1H8YNC7_9PSEU|nr:hypothetical protein SAMN04489732_1307 [Amycolatopsis saalfeldensis]
MGGIPASRARGVRWNRGGRRCRAGCAPDDAQPQGIRPPDTGARTPLHGDGAGPRSATAVPIRRGSAREQRVRRPRRVRPRRWQRAADRTRQGRCRRHGTPIADEPADSGALACRTSVRDTPIDARTRRTTSGRWRRERRQRTAQVRTARLRWRRREQRSGTRTLGGRPQGHVRRAQGIRDRLDVRHRTWIRGTRQVRLGQQEHGTPSPVAVPRARQGSRGRGRRRSFAWTTPTSTGPWPRETRSGHEHEPGDQKGRHR